MKKKLSILLLFIAVMVSNLFLAQKESNQEAALLNVYTKKELKEIQKDNEKYAVFCYALDHALYVIDTPKGKDVSAFPIITCDTKMLPSFVNLKLKINDVSQYFQIAGQNKLLIMKSYFVLQLEMTNSTKQ